jgi:deoxyhypusine synthase
MWNAECGIGVGASLRRLLRWLRASSPVKLFYTGPVINTEMLVVMLEKHGISATQEFVDATLPDDGDLNRLANVFVPEADYDRAHQLFYAEREDEL